MDFWFGGPHDSQQRLRSIIIHGKLKARREVMRRKLFFFFFGLAGLVCDIEMSDYPYTRDARLDTVLFFLRGHDHRLHNS